MLSRTSRALLALMLAIALGWHWTFLQSIAWVGMLAHYSQSAPFGEAVKKTFDGNHPCNLCKFVATGKKSERDQQLQNQVKSLDFAWVQSKPILMPPEVASEITMASPYDDRAIDSPPTPPPRLA